MGSWFEAPGLALVDLSLLVGPIATTKAAGPATLASKSVTYDRPGQSGAGLGRLELG